MIGSRVSLLCVQREVHIIRPQASSTLRRAKQQPQAAWMEANRVRKQRRVWACAWRGMRSVNVLDCVHQYTLDLVSKQAT